jgi:type I restriction enzyme, S subunit
MMEMVKLTAISRPKQWKTLSKENLLEDGYPVYGANGKIGFYNSYTHEFPTLMITCRGATCGSIHISDAKSYINGNAMAIDSLSAEYDIRFLYYFFQYRGFNDVISGSAQPQITGQGLEKVLVPKIPLSTQRDIADLLDKADALRRKDRALLQAYEALAQAIFMDMFGDPVKNEKGWEVKKLGDCFSGKTKCGPFGSALKKDEYKTQGVPVWVMDNIVNYNFNPKDCLFIDKSKYEELESYSVSNGDIIISRAGTVGKMCVVQSEFKHSVISTNLIKLSLDDKKLDPFYFVYLMKCFAKKIGRLKTGSDDGFTHMNTGVLVDLTIPLPDILSQRKFVKILASIEQQKKCLNSEPESLFQTLLQRSFS